MDVKHIVVHDLLLVHAMSVIIALVCCILYKYINFSSGSVCCRWLMSLASSAPSLLSAESESLSLSRSVLMGCYWGRNCCSVI